MGTSFRLFHDKVKALVPDSFGDHDGLWAAVLHTDRHPDENLVSSDLVWFACKDNTSLAKIRDHYKRRFPSSGDVYLQHESLCSGSKSEMTVKDCDRYGDRLAVFEAIVATNPSASHPLPSPNPRNPLLESNFQRPQPVGTLSAREEKDQNSENSSHSAHQLAMEKNGHVQVKDGNLISSAPDTTVGDSEGVVIIKSEGQEPALQAHQTGRNIATGPAQAFESLGFSGTLSRIVKDPNSNWPFLLYLDHFYDRHKGTLGHYSPTHALDLAWESWSKLDAPSQHVYQKKAEKKYSHLGIGLPSSVLSSAKPESVENAIEQPEDEFTPGEMSFESQFSLKEEPEDPLSTFQAPKSFQLQDLVSDMSLEMLESLVEKGVSYLGQLKAPLQDKSKDSSDARRWTDQIDDLQRQAVKTRTVIGVVGNTGAGKSATINALLDEERLVPTNTMRACTAVVTEISWNYSDKKYGAEIEFINLQEWEKELKILFQDLLDDNGGGLKDTRNDDSDAGIAYAKIKAVYPKKTREDIAKSNVETLLREVSHVLGKIVKIQDDDSLFFYKQLQRYIDSKEKIQSSDKDKKKQPKEMEYWPIIKVVRLYTKSPALATGAVIVDLPGVHDANAARAAVAEGYMKQCTGLWICAPIIRAVDDKAAKTLLGETFKRQLKMDGGYGNVSFICTKTDDISLTEASDSLGLEGQNGPLWEKMDQYAKDRNALKEELSELQDSHGKYGEIMADCDDQLEAWEDLKAQIESGKEAFRPTSVQKRKKSSEGNSRKRQKISNDSDDDFIDDGDSDGRCDSEEEGETLSSQEPIRQPLSEEEISQKLHQLKETRRNARRLRLDIDHKIKEIKAKVKTAKDEELKIEAEIANACIQGRNQYSRTAIQQDFAAGLKELDQEIGAEEDEENFNPEVDVRDYDAVAKSLPVFCVSSRGYQKLQGRLRKDPKVAGFCSPEETQIPALQAHCKELTVVGRTATCKRFVNRLSQLLNSMTMWASNDGSGSHLTVDQKERESKFLNKSLNNLAEGLDKLVEKTCKEILDDISIHVFDQYGPAINSARIEAHQLSTKWGSPVNRDNRAAGGYFWATYKAICRRDGVYTNAQGAHDWNDALVEPMMKHIASGWERAFMRRLPSIMGTLTKNASNLLKAFHSNVQARVLKTGIGTAGLPLIEQQLQVYENQFKDLSATTKRMIGDKSKEINRGFVPVVKDAMADAYQECVRECGPGSFARMKAAMNGHVLGKSATMFDESCDSVRRGLKEMVRSVQETLENTSDELFDAVSRDYRSVFGSEDLPHGQHAMPKWHRDMRREVIKIINQAEQVFKANGGNDQHEGGEEPEGNKAEPKPSRDDIVDKKDASQPPAHPESVAENKTEVSNQEAAHDVEISEISHSRPSPAVSALNTSDLTSSRGLIAREIDLQ